ncbi:tRNA wybutosine-synthesizing protein 3 homolog isoform X2 [Acanthaster planci]|uniref:tRNA wybutosine-synthesizing protein 3 homolog n=1 Tax=Acanthaster planci TaxID=133434 RepID=A0A8B7XX08_ACAPL|nr:tRNA wybutosine-synthesizing protein 3 homolog isoform X2 [Acanthaster planci]
MAAPMAFSRAKKTHLENQDLSKKGSLDEEIVGLINYINDTEYLCTTSSCSGRVIIVCEDDGEVIKKKGCHWLYVSHKMTDLDSVENSLKDLKGRAVFKFEPFILHVQCRTLEDAKLVHMVAVESGFRNSGITIGRTGKVMVAVRSTHGLEVPLSDGVQLLVSSQYLAFLVEQANSKLWENSKRIERFYTSLVKRLENYKPGSLPGAHDNLCKKCCKAYAKREVHKSAQDTSAMDTSSVEPMKFEHRHFKNSRRRDLMSELQLGVQMQSREPVSSVLRTGPGVWQIDHADTSERTTAVHECEKLVTPEMGTGDDVIFQPDLFT